MSSTTLKQQVAIPQLTDADIVAYLQAHPGFFEENPQLLGSLTLPHATGGAAVSLVERQVAVLRQKHATMERQLRDFLDVARSNDQLAARIHGLALALLRTRDRAGVVTALEEQLRLSFNADQAVLVLFGEPDLESTGRFLRVVDREDPALSPFRTFLQTNAPRCGQVRDSQRDFLFGEGTVEVGSVALVPLTVQEGSETLTLGFLAIGNRDRDHFHPGKSMDFLVRLGELVSCALRSRD
jgi:uncharacterized protein YigA (DUF484 family)